jgi:hypothetical protein
MDNGSLPDGQTCMSPKIIENPDDPIRGCVCLTPFADDGMGGCDLCADGISYPATACTSVPDGPPGELVNPPLDCDAASNLVDNGSGACVCKQEFTDAFGECVIDCSGKPNSVPSTSELCVA